MVASAHAGRTKTVVILPLLWAAIVASGLCLPLAGASPRSWEQWDNCRFEANQYFDGDSFHITHRGRNQVLRLYFADAPETDTSFPDRVREQAAYFRVTEPQLLEGALRAQQFTARFLEKPFRVITRCEVAPGASRTPRFYARVECDGRRLDEALIRAGLARATTLPAPYPNARTAQTETLRLRRLEKQAARAGRGIWRHSQRELAPARERLPADATADSSRSRGVNLNAATSHELEALPGIGPKLAVRIIRARPLRDLQALEAIPGIGPKKIALLRSLVTFE